MRGSIRDDVGWKSADEKPPTAGRTPITSKKLGCTRAWPTAVALSPASISRYGCARNPVNATPGVAAPQLTRSSALTAALSLLRLDDNMMAKRRPSAG